MRKLSTSNLYNKLAVSLPNPRGMAKQFIGFTKSARQPSESHR